MASRSEEKHGYVSEVKQITLSNRAEKTLQEVLPSDDPLDSPDFDAVAFINKMFPTEQDLGPIEGGELDKFLRKSKSQISSLDSDISDSVRKASFQRVKTEQSILEAKQAIQELFEKVKSIKEKANQSEVMVKEICRDIKKLDYAKKHLTATITALKRLHMLGSAVDQLELMTTESQYQQAALNLEAVDDLFKHFDEYKDIPKVDELRRKVENARKSLQERVFQAFDDFHRTGPHTVIGLDETAEALSYACNVLDVLGVETKERLVHWLCTLQLEPYRAIFSPGMNESSLENTERRFAWLRRQLKKYNERYGKIFPRHWNVPGQIAADFCMMTRDHLSTVLDQTDFDVQTLVRILQKTIQFESELDKYYRVPTFSNAEDYLSEPGAPLDEEMSEAERIRLKYKTMQLQKEAEEKEKKYLEEHGLERKDTEVKTIEFKGMISCCFAAYMGKFVEMEAINMNEVIENVERNETWIPEELQAHENRLTGSDELLVYIKKSLSRCSRLGIKQTMYDVFGEYRRGFQNYCRLLERKLLLPQQPFKKGESGFSEQQLWATCFIVNTCEYICETLPQLQDNIKSLIVEEFKEKINLSHEQEMFEVLMNKAIQVIVSGITAALSKPLTSMSRMAWSTWESVGDQSDYVTQLHQILVRDVAVIANLLSKDYHTYFCSQLAHAFIPTYIQSIYRCRRIGEMGAQQLLLDTHALKTMLLEIPRIGFSESGRRVPPAFTKFVTKEMSRAEGLLKTVASEKPVQTFHTLLPKGHEDDLKSILELKGMKKSEIQTAQTRYRTMVQPSQMRTPMAALMPLAGQDSSILKFFKGLQYQ